MICVFTLFCVILAGTFEDVTKKQSKLIGQIKKKLGTGLLIKLPNKKAGIAHLTELSDDFVENPLDQFTIDDFVE